jgi:hypothetical protein
MSTDEGVRGRTRALYEGVRGRYMSTDDPILDEGPTSPEVMTRDLPAPRWFCSPRKVEEQCLPLSVSQGDEGPTSPEVMTMRAYAVSWFSAMMLPRA